jgi:hypothetical protein
MNELMTAKLRKQTRMTAVNYKSMDKSLDTGSDNLFVKSFSEDEDRLPTVASPKSKKKKANIDKNDPILSNTEFRFLQRGNLTLPLGINEMCIPVEHHDYMSIIAYALNSKQYQ